MWPIHLAFLLSIVRSIILSSSHPCNSLLLRFSRDRLQTHRRRAKTATCIINITDAKQPSNQRPVGDVHTSTLISNQLQPMRPIRRMHVQRAMFRTSPTRASWGTRTITCETSTDNFKVCHPRFVVKQWWVGWLPSITQLEALYYLLETSSCVIDGNHPTHHPQIILNHHVKNPSNIYIYI